MAEAKPKQAQVLHKQPMPRQDPQERVHNFYEVALGYGEDQARAEALRCLQCKKSPCVAGCPVEIDIPSFIGRVREGDFSGAMRKVREKNSLPAICGRVCPQEDQCEKVCGPGGQGRAGGCWPAGAFCRGL